MPFKIKTIVPFALFMPLFAFGNDSEVNSFDLESLMSSDVQLSSVMRRLQSTKDTAASVYVLTGEEILRSGSTSVPQALKLVPGLQVRQINQNLWAITSRASASRYSNKLLVMVDGQSVYDPIHAGVNWEVLKVPLIDIEKIEVIRGQGSLLWGSNATNGVINIITKHSEDTRSLALQANTGTTLNHDVTARYGDDLGIHGSYRVYAMSDDLDSSLKSNRISTPDDSSQSQSVGGRLDFNLSESLFTLLKIDYLTASINSDVYYVDLATNDPFPSNTKDKWDSFNLMSRTEHVINPNTTQMMQLAYSFTQDKSDYYHEIKRTADADYQMNIVVDHYQFDWGLNYRYIDLELEETDIYSLISDVDKYEQYGAFAQVQWDLISDTVKFIVGNKSEHNDFTGWEHQPAAKLLWLVDEQSTVWTSISRGVRIPSITENSAQYRIGGPTLGSLAEKYDPALAASLPQELYSYNFNHYLTGNEDIEPETSTSKEIGYRYMANQWNIDVSLFHTDTKDVMSIETSSSTSVDQLISLYLTNPANFASALASTYVNSLFVTGAEIESYGGELVIGKQILPGLKGEVAYSYVDQDYKLSDSMKSAIGYSSTQQQVMIKASAFLTDSHSLFTKLRYEDGEAYDVDDFFALDVSWQWQASQNLQLGIAANNLLHGDKVEFGNTDEMYTLPTYIEPSFTAAVLVNF
ncbi:TonB-dependent receptor [Vibrio hannami]|uniref:TonB-dependent receptor plug domain-containing protein n=1 Tax=Vibrio hannami TaxID=2717094 RepID=UPI0024100DE4|nr:TonB-dependent receptor [Vibrio hannami]MDG3084913.1 TonB-dependent receptor [Vibrio hannami]